MQYNKSILQKDLQENSIHEKNGHHDDAMMMIELHSFSYSFQRSSVNQQR